MPGTILVSVLEFMGLPLSSTYIKVSMGKTEYLISEKGDFSFPLTSLREDFIIKLQDADENEISHIGFQTKSIVEKGVWEDIFGLGHGHLRLKLQFILSDEDRDKIRMMRESALKKKHDELLRSSSRGSESDGAYVGNAALIFRNDEVSEPPKRSIQLKAISHGKSPAGFQTEEKSSPAIVSGDEPDLMQPHPNSAVYKETSSNKPMSEAFDFTKLQRKGLTKKPAFGSPFSKDPQKRAINSEELVAISVRRSNQNEVAENNLIKPNPSSVRKMISAFEMQTGILAQDMRSPTRSPPTEHRSETSETKASSMAQHLGKEKAWNEGPVTLLQGKSKDSCVARDLKQSQLCNGKELTDSNAWNKFELPQKSDRDEEKYSKDFVRTLASEAEVTDSGKMPEMISDPNKEVTRKNAFKSSGELCIKTDSPLNLNSGEQFDDDNNFFPFEFSGSGAWIFPDDPRKFCLTTGGKNVMLLLDSSVFENMEKNAEHIGTGAEASKPVKIDETKESRSKNSDGNGDEISARPVKKVIKAAIIIGFGIFVLLTRQRKGR